MFTLFEKFQEKLGCFIKKTAKLKKELSELRKKMKYTIFDSYSVGEKQIIIS